MLIYIVLLTLLLGAIGGYFVLFGGKNTTTRSGGSKIKLPMMSKKRVKILIAGICDSGKTTFFHFLVSKREVVTQTSVEENHGAYKTEKGSLEVVDIPGHLSLREEAISKYAEESKAILFLVDITTFMKDFKLIAEYLYFLLTQPDIRDAGLPIKIVLTKVDLQKTEFPESQIQSLLEKELTAIRESTKRAVAEQSGQKNIELGKKDKPIEFSDLPNRISFTKFSIKTKSDKIFEEIEGFLASL